MVAYGALEWAFVIVLIVLVGAVGVFAVYLAANLFRNPSRRP